MIRLEFGIVLCAGLGIRLRPLTDHAPKPLLRFMDRPIAGYALDALRGVGVARIGVNAHHKPDQLAAWLRDTEHAWAADGGDRTLTNLVVEEALMGTGGGAFGVWNALGAPQSTVAVINGDVVADFPLDTMLKVHRRTGAVATLLMLPTQAGEAAVYLDERGHFVSQLPSPNDVWSSPRYAAKQPVTFGGVYLLEPAVFENLRAQNSCLIRHGVGPLLAEGATVAAYRHDGFWADLGTPGRFMAATRRVLEDPSVLPSAPVKARADGVYVGERRELPTDVTLTGPAYVASGARVGHGAHIGPGAVIGTGCNVAPGVRVENAILMHGAQVTTDLHDRIVCGTAVART